MKTRRFLAVLVLFAMVFCNTTVWADVYGEIESESYKYEWIDGEQVIVYTGHKQYYNIYLKKGTETYLHLDPVDMGAKSYAYSVEDSSILSLEEESTTSKILIKANEVGTTKIMVYKMGYYDLDQNLNPVLSARLLTIPISVYKTALQSITLNYSDLPMTIGDSIQLKVASHTPVDAELGAITWSSSDKSIATVSEDGVVTAVSLGEVRIYAKANRVMAACDITVKSKYEIVVKPTLTEQGVALSYDENGKKVSTYVPPLNDTSAWSLQKAAASTCINAGYRTYYSPIYGELTLESALADHKWTVISETDLGNGTTECDYKCSICSKTKTEVIPDFKYYANSDGTIDIYGFTYGNNLSGEIVFPSEINGKKVKSVALDSDVGYYDLSNVTGLIFEDGIENITPEFSGLTKLKSVILPNSLTIIERESFKDCTALEKVVIPDSVEYIGESAFQGCTALTDVTLGANVIEIDVGAFAQCPIEKLDLPETIEILGRSCFSAATVKEITLPSGLRIFEDAFSNIEYYYIPSTVTYMDTWAYPQDPTCKGIYISEDNQTYSSDSDGVLYNKDKTTLLSYPGGKPDESYSIADVTETIESIAFFSNPYLQTLNIPKSIISIGGSAFYNCSGLKTIVYDGNRDEYKNIDIQSGNNWLETAEKVYKNDYLWEIGSDGALTITGIGEIKDFETTSEIPWYSQKLNITKIIVSDGITSIGGKAFYGCINATTAELPESVMYIGENAFKNCDEISIVGVKDSYAHEYAVAHNIPFINAVASKPLEDLDVELSETTARWYFYIPNTTYTENAIIYAGIYDENNKLLSMAVEDMVSDDVTSVKIDKVSGYSYAKVFEWVDNTPITNTKLVPLN